MKQTKQQRLEEIMDVLFLSVKEDRNEMEYYKNQMAKYQKRYLDLTGQWYVPMRYVK